jgi:hypothetical protein
MSANGGTTRPSKIGLIGYWLIIVEGKRVIRLKGSESGVFGRVYPEMLALKQAGCDFELITGISSALSRSFISCNSPDPKGY